MNHYVVGRLVLAMLLASIVAIPGEAQHTVNPKLETRINNPQIPNQQFAGPKNFENRNLDNQVTGSQLKLQVNQFSGTHNATNQLLRPRDNCFHVIRLIHMYGVNQSVYFSNPTSAVHSPTIGMLSIPANEIGDLQLTNITNEEHEDDSCGPRFLVTLANHSLRDIENFHVTLVATLGRIYPDSPTATVRVAQIAAGMTAQIRVQLPVEAWAMGNRDGEVFGYQPSIVAIDAFDELVETNEANNLKVFHRSEIPIGAVIEHASGETVEQLVESSTIDKATADLADGSASGIPQDNGNPLENNKSPGGENLRRAIRMLNTSDTDDQQAQSQNPATK